MSGLFVDPNVEMCRSMVAKVDAFKRELDNFFNSVKLNSTVEL